MSKRKSEPEFEQWDAVEIEWVDSERTDGWRLTHDDDPPHALTCRTVGILYRADDESITVVLSASGIAERGEQFCGSITIPRVAVVAVRKLA